MTSLKKDSSKSIAGVAKVSHDTEVAESVRKPVAPWLIVPRRGLFYLSSLLFVGWLCFLAVIAYLVNFQ